ncbi:DnaJ C-terminal domain-containing protein [Rhodomicrobium sp.]|uniref:DnaJ C-terminal domain-containing protein n=1 Tax=Rhodomicrobium sp. TaxID=2720632 RepID=UPI0039E54997
MDQDLYAVLGLKRTATNDEIRRAYRKLAKDLHPDQNKGDPVSEEKFKRVSAAFAVLGSPEKRKRYDAGEIDSMGNERAHQFYRDYGAGGGSREYEGFGGYQNGGSGGGDFSDIFGDLFGRRGPSGAFTMRGMDYRYNLEISFLEAVNGVKKRVQFPDNETLDITVPAGVESGQTLRLRHKGGPGAGRGEPGDALIELKIQPHPLFARDGDNITLELPVSLHEAVLGSRVEVPTIGGRVTVAIPKGASSGQVLRLRGKGVTNARTGTHGDQLITLKIMLPPAIDPELERFMQEWAKKHPYDPRARFREAAGV